MDRNFQTQVQDVIERLDPGYRSQGKRDVDALLAAGADSIERLIALLLDISADPDLRSAAAWLLARLGDDQALPALLTALADQHDLVRAAAARSLGELGGEQSSLSVQSLTPVLFTDPDVEVRAAAAYALGLLGDPASVEPLIQVLTNAQESPRVRGLAAEALADIRDARAVLPLVSALADSVAEVRFWSAFALGELGAVEAVPTLQKLAATDDALVPGLGRVREEATAALGKIEARRV